MVRFFTTLFCLAVFAGWVGAQPFHPDGPPGCGRTPEKHETLMKLKEELKLTDDQLERLRDIRIELKRTGIEKRAELASIRLDLQEMLGEIEVNRSQVEEKIKEIGRIRTELELAKIDALLRAREVLTPEQLEKLRALGFPIMRVLPPEKPMRIRE